MKNPEDTRDVVPRFGSPPWIYLTAVSFAGADDFGASTAAAGMALLIASALAQPETPVSPVASTSMQMARKVDFMVCSVAVRSTIRF